MKDVKENFKLIYRKDYRRPDYYIETADLTVDLYENYALVSAVLCGFSDVHDGKTIPLILDGEDLKLISLRLNGRLLSATQYTCTETQLILFPPGPRFELETQVKIEPSKNTALMGLYKSSFNFCTQCEADGFRRITYYIDRPDNLAWFTTTIIADKVDYPILLSNGNKIASGDGIGGRHWVKWKDPFKKSPHLFALIAGQFECLKDHFITSSGRRIALFLFVEKGNLKKADHAMQSLKQAMRWDEVNYGREYDLDNFMIVAVSDFNMGAMENKGLNIFNSRYILADSDTETDADFEAILAVVSHEYFHNWSGNRVGCRDWFQLSLKEGFTVFREQCFMEDQTASGVERIESVKVLRAVQFSEDRGPLAHPVRPDSYIEVNNFYTATVYEKGAEIIRMLQIFLGKEKFRKATDLYFSRFDGQAVTVDDFIDCMQVAGQFDLTQFRLWYSQAGTPELTVKDHYDQKNKTYTLTVKQYTSPTPDQPRKEPLLIPLKMSLLDASGQALPLILRGENQGLETVLCLNEVEHAFHFENIAEFPSPSLLRGFSAPVKLSYSYTPVQLKCLLLYDSDPFVRWEALQALALKQLLPMISFWPKEESVKVDLDFLEILEELLNDPKNQSQPDFLALLLILPSEAYLESFFDPVNPIAIYEARQMLRRRIAERLSEAFYVCYKKNQTKPYRHDPFEKGQRSLKNVCLAYLMMLENNLNLAVEHYHAADNMTDRYAALSSLNHIDCGERGALLDHFFERYKNDPLVLDKWFSIQSTSPVKHTLATVQNLMEHPAFDLKNPNKVRALLGAFSQANPLHFHDLDGSGYTLLSDCILKLDPLNPQMAAQLVEPLTEWKHYTEHHARLMKKTLEKLQAYPLSKNTYEIVKKSLI